MIRVLFLLSHTERGGGEVVVYNLVKYLDRSRFEPYVGHVDFQRGEFIQEFAKLGTPAHDFGARHLRNPMATVRAIGRLARFIRQQRIDVIVTSGAHNHIYAAFARRLAPVPIVTYVMNHYDAKWSRNPVIVRLALRLDADYYVAASRACLEPLEQIISPTRPRRVIYHGVDLDFVKASVDPAAVREQLGLKPDQKLVSMIGRLQRWKGQDLFLHAAARVAASCPEAQFAIVGGSLFGLEPDYPDELQRLRRELKLQDRCWLLGHQIDVKKWILASDVVVQAARRPEPGANVVIEAMALARPVVAPAAGAPSEIIEDGINGLLFTPGVAEDLAAAVLRLLQEPGLADEIGKRAVSSARSMFSANRMSDEMGEVLQQVTTNSRYNGLRAHMPRKTILFTISSCWRAGHEMALRNTVKVVDRGRFRPIAAFLCLSERGPFPDELRALGTDVYVRRVGRLRNPLNVARTVTWLVRLIRRERVALIISGGGHNHPYARLAGLFTRCPILCYETFLFKKPFWRNGPIYTANFILGTTAYLSYGKSAAQTISAANPWSTPVIYQPQMVDLKMFDYHQNGSDFRRLMRIPDDAFVFMMIGRIQEWKGQDVFVRAALEVSKTYPNSYFIVVGSPWQKADFRFEAMLRRWVLEAGAEKRVIFSPFVAEPAEVYAAADVVCHCSREPEPFGLVIVEAMAMKKPVIAMKAGGPLETVREGVDGWLVRPGDATALAEVMRDCLHAGDQLIRAGEEGYRSVVTRFGETAFSKGINELIDRYTRRSECRGR